MVELALSRHGHIDALVNNDAFPALRAPLAEARLEDYRSALGDDGGGAVPAGAARGAGDAQTQIGSHRLGVVGGAARGIANYAPYVSARAANGLVSSLAKELGRDGITVNAVGSNYVENPDYFPPALLANRKRWPR